MHVDQIIRIKGGDVITCTPEASIQDAAKLLAQRKIGFLVVINEHRRLVGVLSERDIIRGLAEHGERVPRMRVADLLTEDVITCKPTTSPRDVMATMNARGFRHMPVVEHGRLVGLLSSRDILKYLVEEAGLDERSHAWAELNFL